MTAYTLRDERYRTCRLVFVLQDGGQRHRTANAHLSTGAQGDYAIVYVPAHAEPVNAPTRQPDWVDSRNGYAMYDFTSHQDALDFLCALYGLDAPQPDPEPVDTTQEAGSLPLEVSPCIAAMSLPAPAACTAAAAPVEPAKSKPSIPMPTCAASAAAAADALTPCESTPGRIDVAGGTLPATATATTSRTASAQPGASITPTTPLTSRESSTSASAYRSVSAFPLLGRDVIHIAPLFWGRAYPHPEHSNPRNRQ